MTGRKNIAYLCSIVAAWLVLGFSVAVACNIPVFRYALERWKPDQCEIIVYYDAELTEAQNQVLSQFSDAVKVGNRQANFVVVRVPINENSNNSAEVTPPAIEQYRELWQRIKPLTGGALPYVVVRASIGIGKSVPGWHGSLEALPQAKLLDSPIRQELTQRLLGGDSVVWLVLKSSDESKNQKVREMLSEQLARLSGTIEFPDGLGLPGSELYSDVPLLMQFSMLEIDPTDTNEQFLISLFENFQSSDSQSDTLLIPVFGRGRALEVIPSKQIDAGLVEDLTRYLCAACSCQVKERNPGFDLLLAANWDIELFGEEANAPPPEPEDKVGDLKKQPTLLTIPPGKKKK